MLLQNNAASSGPERGLAERKVGISRTKLEALEHIAANVDLFFAVTLAELNIFHVMDTLDETIAHSDLNDRDDLVNKNRMPAARAFTQQSPVMCVSRRTQGVWVVRTPEWGRRCRRISLPRRLFRQSRLVHSLHDLFK